MKSPTSLSVSRLFGLFSGGLLALVFAGTMLLTAEEPEKKVEEKWVPLFNGKDLDGWTPKIRYHELGENYGNTFRVEDGLLKVRYDKESYPEFGEKFGHLFYKTSFSRYRIRVEYRFVGEQAKGGPGWAIRNSGIMIHGQDPKTMAKDQDFPNSIEVQLLGGNDTEERSTSNLCTPGTQIILDGKLEKRHCTNSTSKTYRGEQWVTAEVEVNGSESVKHILEGKVVLEYKAPQLDDGTLLEGGTISLQSESHPVDFRKVEILVLDEKANTRFVPTGEIEVWGDARGEKIDGDGRFNFTIGADF